MESEVRQDRSALVWTATNSPDERETFVAAPGFHSDPAVG